MKLTAPYLLRFILIAEGQLFERHLASDCERNNSSLIVEELFLERRLFTFRATRSD